ncbi:MAG: AAA family ATPase [Gemmatimonadota bacterium]
MTIDPMRELLAKLGLEQYAAVFEHNEVDLAALRILTEADLQELGLPFGPRKKLLRAVAEFAARDTAGWRAARAGDARTEGERRQLTVLFCDMVGFTELSSRVDPEQLRDVIRDYEAVCGASVTRYDGYVFQRLGDGIVAFFGYPHAHEGEAERAIRAGLDIIETFDQRTDATSKRRVRIGIASGVVVVSPSDGSAIGETMNLAARLQAVAEPGSVVIAESAHQLAGGAFTYADLGELDLKGIARKTRAYRVSGRSSATSRFEAATQAGVTPLVGRRQELEVLLEQWKQASAGTGRMVLVSGEAGLGKSRMISALRERLDAVGAGALRFQCSPYGMNSAFHPFLDALQRALRFEPAEVAESKLDKLEALMLGRYGLPREDVPFLASVLSIPSQSRYAAPALSARRQKEESIRVMVDMTESAARAQPTLLLFEDVHWADPSTLEVLDLLVRRLGGIPLMAVLTHRPEFVNRWPTAAHVTSLDLSRLQREDARSIVGQLARGKALPPQLVEQILDKAGGVPLFLEEVTKAVLESGSLIEREDRYEYSGSAADIVLPATLRDSLMARLDRVPAVKEIAQIGAVIGREFSYELVAEVSPMPADALDVGLDQLTDSGLAFRHGTIPAATFTFKHALVQDVAYDSLLKTRRAELHGAIAGALTGLQPEIAENAPEVLARHYTAATLDKEAIPHWTRAGERALQRTALPEAIAHLRAGLASSAKLPHTRDRDLMELRLRTRLGPAELSHKGWAAGDVGAALEPAWRLAEALDDRESVLPVAYGLWVHTLTAGRLAESMRWAERMLEAASASKGEALELSGHRAALASRFWQGDYVAARHHGDALRRLYDRERHAHIGALTTSDPLAGDGMYRAHFLWMLGYPDQARAVARETAEHARGLNRPFEVAFALTLGAQVFEYCHQADDLLQCADEAERVGKQFGVPLMSEIMAEISRGEAWLIQDRLDDGIHQLRESAKRLNATGQRIWVAYLGVRVGEAVARAGDAVEGLRLMNESLAREDCREDRAHIAESLRLKGWLLRTMGRTSEAEQALMASLEVARAQQAKSWELRGAMELARLLADRGERTAARELLAPVYGWFTEGFDTRDLVVAKTLLDSLTP